MEVATLDAEHWEEWGKDEQETAYDRLQQLKHDFDGTPTKLFINQDEELQSYLMWFATMENLAYEITDGETRICG